MTPATTALPTPADALQEARQEQFALLVCEGHTATDAYRRAYDVDDTTKPGTVNKYAMRLRHTQHVADRIRHLQATVALRSTMSTAELVADLEQMAMADINELIRVDVYACRYCHGAGHAYQWIDAEEFARAVDEHLQSHGAKPLPSAAGGFGHVPTSQPHPDCPRCLGDGTQRVRLGNTADASPGARKLFKGVELFPDGQIKRLILHDQLALRQELHKLRGLHVDRSVSLALTAKIEPTKDLTPEQIVALMAQQRVLA